MRFRYVSPDAPWLTFTWGQGPYIDVENEKYYAVDAINVWDYEIDKPTIGVDYQSFKNKCEEWLNEEAA